MKPFIISVYEAVPLRNGDYKVIFRKTEGEMQQLSFKLQNIREDFNTKLLTKTNIVVFKG